MKMYNRSPLGRAFCLAMCVVLLICAAQGISAFASDNTRYNPYTTTVYSGYSKKPTTTQAPTTTAAPTTTQAPETTEKSLSDLKNEYNKLDAEIEENEKKLNEITNSINTNEDKLELLNSQISAIKRQISILQDRIDELNYDIKATDNEIAQLTADIALLDVQITDTQQKIDESKATMESTEGQVLGRLRAAYMSGEASSLEILFSSADLSTFFTRKELIERVTENDRDLIEELRIKSIALEELEHSLGEQKETHAAKKADLDTKRVELVANKRELDADMQTQKGKQSSLSSKSAEVEQIISQLDQNSDAYQKQLEIQRREREEIEKQIDDYIRQHGSSKGDIPDKIYNNDGKMTWPVPYENTYISAGYPTYPSGGAHWGIDIVVRDSDGTNISNGKTICAAQGGEVIYASPNDGGNNSFGNYLIIDHGDGVMTLYAHCKRIVVSKGDIVKKGQKVAEIGLTGNTTGYHLHFEVRIKQADGTVSRVQPLNYVSKPSN